MHTPRKRWLVLAVLMGLLIWVALSRYTTPRQGKAVIISFVGYTNANNTSRRFALFSVSNQAPYSIVWRGDWVEVEGNPEHKGRITNPTLPGSEFERILTGGHSLTMAVGEPIDSSQSERWRFTVAFSKYKLEERLLDLSAGRNLPMKLVWLLRVDNQRILSPSNRVAVSSAWLGE